MTCFCFFCRADPRTVLEVFVGLNAVQSEKIGSVSAVSEINMKANQR